MSSELISDILYKTDEFYYSLQPGWNITHFEVRYEDYGLTMDEANRQIRESYFFRMYELNPDLVNLNYESYNTNDILYCSFSCHCD